MAWKNLTRSERKHLWENNIRSLEDMKQNREGQRKLAAASTGHMKGREICWDCKRIARKMGLE